MKTPVDTVYFYLNPGDFELEREHNFRCKPLHEPSPREALIEQTTEPDRDLIYRDREKEYRGDRLYHNSETGSIVIEIRRERLGVKFSLPRIKSEFITKDGTANFTPAQEVEARECFRIIENYISLQGVNLSIDNINFGRVDLFKNLSLEYPFKTYHPVFPFLEMKYSRGDKAHDGFLDGFKTSTATNELCLYDKVEALKDVYNINIETEENIGRAEYRLIGGKELRKTSEVFSDLKTFLSETEELNKVYFQKMQERIFRVKEENLSSDKLFANEVEILREYKKRYPRNAIHFYLAQFGLPKIIENLGGSTEALKELLLSEFNRSHVHSTMRQYREAMNFSNDKRKGTLSSLYTELKEKVLQTA